MSSGDYAMRNVKAYTLLIRTLEYVAQVLARYSLLIGTLVGLVRYGDDVTKARSYRSQVVWEEANERGIRMQQVYIASMPVEAYRAHIHSSWRYFISLPFPPDLSPTRLWFDDKYVLKKFLRSHNIPAPQSEVTCTVRHARTIFKKLTRPVVVKPRLGSRGRHTTTNVRDEETLIRACRVARKLCAYVSIEEELRGCVCRGTVIGGRLCGFLEARPTHIVGDGVHTIRECVEIKNKQRPERMSEIQLTREVEQFLERNGRTLSSVPTEGETVVLTHRTGRLFGGETRELLETVHPKLRSYLERAAKALDVPIVGFDLIVQDPERDPDKQKWGIIEANTLPFIDLHYLPLNGKPSKTARAVWDLWELKA